jgi:hypothetical protein
MKKVRQHRKPVTIRGETVGVRLDRAALEAMLGGCEGPAPVVFVPFGRRDEQDEGPDRTEMARG